MKLLNMIFNILSNRSIEWSKVRKEHLKKQPLCAACGSNKKIQVHHIEPFHLNPEKELDTDNLITLCSSCHFIFGHLMDWKSWNKEVIKDCEVYLNKVKNKPHIIRIQSNENITFSSRCFLFLSSLFWWNNRS